MIHPPKLDDIFRDPTRHYETPAAVVDDIRLSGSQKLEILKAWPFAAEELDAPHRNLNLAYRVNPCLTLPDKHINLPQLRNNIFRFVSFGCHP